ncbi:MAG: tellurite resistance TerB family protein [Pseudomonadota bacterium]
MSFDMLLNQFIGGGQTADSGQNAGQSANSGLTSSIPTGLIGGLAAGGLMGAIAGNKKFRKSATKVAGGVAGLGGAALLGVFAHKAYRNWQTGRQQVGTDQPNEPQIDSSRFDPDTIHSTDGQPFKLTLVKAMIAASYADGHIDPVEHGKIFDALDQLDMDANEKAVFFDLLRNPPSVEEIASLANGLEQASEIYLMSRMAIDPDHPSERAYLNDLATLMNLPDGLVEHLEGQIIQEAANAA